MLMIPISDFITVVLKRSLSAFGNIVSYELSEFEHDERSENYHEKKRSLDG